jgi:predicted acyltransferase
MKRIISIDVLRGLTVALMIIVNNPGSWGHIYAPLRHASWSGCTPTDLVFPFFLFIVGLAMFFAFKKFNFQLTKESTYKILKRTVLIFLVGNLLHAFPFFGKNYEYHRIMGVLQRIALCYGIASFVCLSLRGKKLIYFSGALLLIYWGLFELIVPEPYSKGGNLGVVIDRFIFGENHLYKGFGVAFDPEGLFSCISASVNTILGFITGKMLFEYKEEKFTLLKKLGVFGFILVVLGLVWDLIHPINKPLWTSSYVIYTSGLAMLVLAVCIFIVDIKAYKKWTKPFIDFGVNPLFIFVLSGLIAKLLYMIKVTVETGKSISLQSYIYKHILLPTFGDPKFASLIFALSLISILWVIAWFMHKKKVFIKL